MRRTTLKMIERQIDLYNTYFNIVINPIYKNPRLELGSLAGYYKIYITCDRLLEHDTIVSGTKKECFDVIYALNKMVFLSERKQ